MKLLGDVLRERLGHVWAERGVTLEIEAAEGLITLDGLPWCEVCHGTRWVRRDAALDDPDFGRAFRCGACPPEVHRARIQKQLDRVWRDVPPHFRDFTLDSWPGPRSVVDELRGWLDGERWLYLHGPVGRGKSGLAVALLAELIERESSGLFVVVPEMLARIRSTYGNREAADADEGYVMASLYAAEVLVLDDLGAERATDWAVERLFMVIGFRHDHHRRTIVTSNLSLEDLSEHWGNERAAWRIRELADVVRLDGPNLRARA